jgi:hypothetical protein
MRAIRYFLYVLLDAIQTMPKLLRQRKTVILDAAVLVTGRVFAAGAELLAQNTYATPAALSSCFRSSRLNCGFIRL